jgi:hypothetical protein|tara:strand:- start:291 stop:563 length:273 start_codon:yes stop_codon:yes gene_type:complete
MNKLFYSTLLFGFWSSTVSADILTADEMLIVLGEGTVISSFVGEGSTARKNKQGIYVLHDETLFFCNLHTQKLRSTTEAVVKAECFKTSG